MLQCIDLGQVSQFFAIVLCMACTPGMHIGACGQRKKDTQVKRNLYPVMTNAAGYPDAPY